MTAKTLEEALNSFAIEAYLVFTPDAPPESSPDFYIDRERNPFKELKNLLLHSRLHDKVLFTGHRGSGKSTELNRLASDPEIQGRFFIVKFDIMKELDINDVRYVDVLLSIAANIFDQAVRARLKLGQELLQDLKAWRDRVEKVVVTEKKLEGSLEGGLQAFLVGLRTKITGSKAEREEVRQVVEPELSLFLGLLDKIIEAAKLALPASQELLVVIDDLDKIPNAQLARALYLDTGLYLSRPRCKMIYTVPLALHYAPAFKNVLDNFGVSYFLPNVAPWHEREAKETPGFETMKGFVARRMELNLIEEGALERAIHHSGGVMKEMARIMHLSCLKALTKDRSRIAVDITDEVVADLRNLFDRSLEEEEYPALAVVHNMKHLGAGDLSLRLLNEGKAIEYQDGKRWCDVNPIILPLLRRRKLIKG